jgi:RimJ/RimL family protein N-acetyltransferase
MPVTNHLGQPVGDPLPGWRPPPFPPHERLTGRYCELLPLTPGDAPALWRAYALDAEGRNWTYLTHGPYEGREDFDAWVAEASASRDPQFYAVRTSSGGVNAAAPAPGSRFTGPDVAAVGVASYLRITPAMGVIEVGHIHFSPLLQRTPAATEAMYLMMRHAFELGYRRYEWKCDALNAPSRRAAERLGLSFEGVFRQAIVVKGRNRDTAWYACIDSEWPAIRDAFERWLDPANFDADGRQRSGLTMPKA